MKARRNPDFVGTVAQRAVMDESTRVVNALEVIAKQLELLIALQCPHCRDGVIHEMHPDQPSAQE